MHDGYTLVVEDDLDELDTILSALPAGTIRVVVEDGGEALRILYGRTPKGLGAPALIVIDLDSSRVRDFQLPQLVRAHPRTAHLPMVTLVGSNADVCRARNGRIVSDWFVRKPTGSFALGAAIEAAHACHAPRPDAP